MGDIILIMAVVLVPLLLLEKVMSYFLSLGARRRRYRKARGKVFSHLPKQAWGLLRFESKGRRGERLINELIAENLDPEVYHLIPDVTLPRPGGTTQIDHVVVSKYGIFVLETKYRTGWIFGREQDAKWTQTLYKQKNRFQNPLRQNYLHTKTLSDLTGIPHSYFKSVVLFVGDCEFKTSMPPNVVQRRSDFINHVKAQQTPIIKDTQVPEIVSVIQEWAGTVSEEQKSLHVENLHSNKGSALAEGDAPICPRCGFSMRLRTNSKDGSKFWGCPRYPDCRGTRSTG